MRFKLAKNTKRNTAELALVLAAVVIAALVDTVFGVSELFHSCFPPSGRFRVSAFLGDLFLFTFPGLVWVVYRRWLRVSERLTALEQVVEEADPSLLAKARERVPQVRNGDSSTDAINLEGEQRKGGGPAAGSSTSGGDAGSSSEKGGEGGSGSGASRASARRVKLELPLLVGVLLGWGWILYTGTAFAPTSSPRGFDWSEYLSCAWMVVHRMDVGFGKFRSPLYPGMLGALGEQVGYPYAGVVLSSIGIFLTVAGAGIGARALANPWAGGLAALSMAMVNGFVKTNQWISAYPLMAGLVAVGLALGACAARWPAWYWALPAGFVSGVAWAMDERNLAIVAAVGGLVALGASRLPGWRQRARLVLAFLALLWIGPSAETRMALAGQSSAEARYLREREGILNEIVNHPDRALATACANEPRREVPNIRAFFRPCARALWRYNLLNSDACFPFNWRLSLWLLPLVLLPRRGDWRSVLAAFFVFAPPMSVLAAMCLWLAVPLRYVLPYAAPLAMVVPVAMARPLGLIPGQRLRQWLTVLVMVGAGCYVCSSSVVSARGQISVANQYLGPMMSEIQDRVGPEDSLLDCSNSGLQTALLPERYNTPPTAIGSDAELCRDYISRPRLKGETHWLVTHALSLEELSGRKDPQRLEPGESPPECIPAILNQDGSTCEHGFVDWQCPYCSFDALSDGRWALEFRSDYFNTCQYSLFLWRWRGEEDSDSD